MQSSTSNSNRPLTQIAYDQKGTENFGNKWQWPATVRGKSRRWSPVCWV